MTVVSVEKGADSEVLNVRLQDGSSFFLRRSYLDPVFRISDPAVFGRELNPEEEASLHRAGERFRAERSALRIIALREHSRAGLMWKLKKRGFDERDATVVLDRLIEVGLVNDERFAELWVESRLSRKNEGPAVLAARLRNHGVSREIAAAAASRVAGGEHEVLLVERYLASVGGRPSRDDPALRERLRKAGFSSGAIREAFERLDQ